MQGIDARPARIGPTGVLLGYAVFVAVWAASANWVTALSIGNEAVLPGIGIAKGLVFVLVTASVLFALYRMRRPGHSEARPGGRLGARHLFLALFVLAALVPLLDIGVAARQAGHLESEAKGALAKVADMKVREIETWLSAQDPVGRLAARVRASDTIPLSLALPRVRSSAEAILFRESGMQTELLARWPSGDGRSRVPFLVPGPRSGLADAFIGVDPRGVRVIAAEREIPGTDWRLLIKIDRSEIVAPLWSLVSWVTVVAVTAIALLALGAGILLWRQRLRERKHHEAIVRDREADLNRAQALARIGSWVLNVGRDELTWSAECYRIFGVAPGTPVSYGLFLSLVHPEDRARVDEAWTRALNGDPYEVDHRIVVDGQTKWIRERAELCLDADGRLLDALGTAQDITTQRESEDRLRQAAMVFERSREGIMVTDAARSIRMVNPAFCEMMGYAEEEILGRTPDLFRSGRHDPAFYRSIWAALARSGHWKGEIWDRRKDGRVFPALLGISAIQDAEGEVSGYVGVFTDISRIKESEEKLAHLAFHDALTGLPNRNLLLSRLQHSVEASRRRRRRTALLMLDLDHFGDINDSFGHLAGDELLQHAAKRLVERLRRVDMIAHLGGDEFTILLEDIDALEDALHVAEAVNVVLGEPYRLSNGAEVRVGVSIGISLFPDHGGDAETLLQQADTALYRAKGEGTGRCLLFSDDLTTAARRRLDLHARLHRAVQERQFCVYYQPQAEITSGRIVGAEALVRWFDPERGSVPPDQWIPVAEESGLIDEIGEWVLREACRQGQKWIAAGLPAISLAVNLSPRQFRHGDIGAAVTRILNETGFPPDRLKLELTESALMTHEDEAERVLRELRAAGIRLAIDDFGTGYSSLGYLKRFPLDLLKIDKSFVGGVPHDADDCEITRAVIALAHSLGLRVLAEGVETEKQLAFITALGCDSFQGYLLSPAVEPEAFAGILKASTHPD